MVAFVANGGWLTSNAGNGMRMCLAREFTHIYVFNLRGYQRVAGDRSRQEGGKIFGGGSRSTIAIVLMVRSASDQPCEIRYRDIGDYLSREEKLAIVDESTLASINEVVDPDEHGDWINKGDVSYSSFAPLGRSPRSESQVEPIFGLHSPGVVTSRDTWVWGYSSAAVSDNVQRLLRSYNSEVERVRRANASVPGSVSAANVRDFVESDPRLINWSVTFREGVLRGRELPFEKSNIVVGDYRPFCRQYLYFDHRLHHSSYRQREF